MLYCDVPSRKTRRQGLKDIPVEAQAIAVADIYDALTNPRSYRKFAYSHNKAIDIMKKIKA